jgi:HAD superfamily hydrolase (TIGR01509 family)
VSLSSSLLRPRPASAPLRIRAVAFDLDGLMFNTEVVFQLSGTELLRRRGKVPPPELWQRMMGRRAQEAFQAMIDLCGLTEPIPQLQVESEAIFNDLLEEHLRPMPGLMELLDLLEERQLPKAVATSSHRPYLHRLLGRFGLLERFDFTLTAEDVAHGKPHPEIYLKAAERHGVPPAEMLVLEDSENGARAAAAAGTHVIAIPHEFSHRHDFAVANGVARSLLDPLILNLLRPQ